MDGKITLTPSQQAAFDGIVDFVKSKDQKVTAHNLTDHKSTDSYGLVTVFHVTGLRPSSVIR